MTPQSFQRTAARAALLLALAGTLVLAGCGGEDEKKPEPIGTGSSNASPGAPEFGRNVVRIPGLSPEDTAASALMAVYPPEENVAPTGWLLYPKEEWRLAVAAAQFAGAPVDAGVLPTERRFFPTPILDVIERVEPAGFPRGGGLETIMLGNLGSEIVVDLQRQDLRLTELDAPTGAELVNELAPYRGGYAEAYSDTILVVSSEEAARDYALIGAAWSAFSGDTIAFVDSSGVPAATRDLIATREGLRTRLPTVYVLGPEELVPESVVAELAGLAAEVKRIPGDNVIDAAVELARYGDEETAFGFGIDEGPAAVTLVNVKQDWQNLYAALILAGAGPRAPIIPIDSATRLPSQVSDFLTALKSEQPNQAFVVGDRKGIGSPLVAEIDKLMAPARRDASKSKEEGG